MEKGEGRGVKRGRGQGEGLNEGHKVKDIPFLNINVEWSEANDGPTFLGPKQPVLCQSVLPYVCPIS